MAKYRLRSAHYLPGDKWLPGDVEMSSYGKEDAGTIVGDGTEHPIKWPTMEMEPLDDEAREMIAKEEARIMANSAVMNPVDALPLDSYETQYVPGMNIRRGEVVPDGSPVVKGHK